MKITSQRLPSYDPQVPQLSGEGHKICGTVAPQEKMGYEAAETQGASDGCLF